jgi:hypothetical protein
MDISNSLYSQSTSSQIAWLAGLNPHFDSPTGDQKFLRKVSSLWLAAGSPCACFCFDLPRWCLTFTDVHHRHHRPQDQQRRVNHAAG